MLALSLLLMAAAAEPPPPAGPPTLAIGAQVHADSITVKQRGEAKIRVWAEPGGEGDWSFDRGGLPKPIPVGKRFDNVDLGFEAEARIDETGVKLNGDANASAQDSKVFIPTPLGGVPLP